MKIATVTLGCKVNQYETQAMERALEQRGHSLCRLDASPDAVIINTCAVTAESGRKSRQAVRRAKSSAPGAVIAVCGCFSQLSPEETAGLGADLVFGSGERMPFVEELEKVFAGRKKLVRVDDAAERKIFEPLSAGSVTGRTRAMLKIEDGCENWCAYCVIPSVRGPVRSLEPDLAVSEAVRLAAEGYRELVITGIEISSYGRDLGSGVGLASLVSRIAAAAPEMRLRLGSLDPAAVTEDFCAALPSAGLCRHFHLSVQSGCTATLRRMNRRNTAEELIAVTDLLRRRFPGCALTADLITGFPGEDEREFAETLETVRRCAFSSMHVFPYSRRPGTRACDMPGQVTEAVKAERAARVRALAGEMKAEYLASCVGKTLNVLFETEKNGLSTGHSDNYCTVCAAKTGLRGQLLDVEIEKCMEGGLLLGHIAS